MKVLTLLVLLQVGMLSQYVSKKEAYSSPLATKLGIKNVPTLKQEAYIMNFCRGYIDPLRRKVGPLHFNSFFRSELLNKAVGGASASDHMVKGDVVACDIDNDGKPGTMPNTTLFYFIRNNTNFYKIIWEFGTDQKPDWVHIGVSTDPRKNEMKRAYRAKRENNRTVYILFK